MTEQEFSQEVSMARPKILHMLLGKTGSLDTAEDALQDACVKAWERLEDFRQEASFSTWLFKIASTCLLDEARKRTRQKRGLGKVEHLVSIVNEEGDSFIEPEDTNTFGNPEKMFFNKLLKERLYEAMRNRCDQRWLNAFFLVNVNGYTIRESAKIMGIPEATVKTYAFRARQALKSAVTSYNQ